ncbi:unnamed protein product [Phytophthora lilii]|uniref:Unnamed protein product n=1 Tax=Phytophthora lilii TaxID=2077276 RepID=A0A9W6TIR7_9STRA|nr:unnamed protein product [Phytophthora lilii]
MNMEPDTYEQMNSSTSAPLVDDADILRELTTHWNVRETRVHTSSPVTLPADVCSPSYSVLNTDDAVGLTPDEAAELLKALDASDEHKTSVAGSPASQYSGTQVLALKEQNQRRKPGRKKAKTPSTGKMRNPSRERLQNELAYLRRKVVELEGELRVLQPVKRPDLSLIGSDPNKKKNGGAGARVWQRIAQRQAQGRDEAEMENRRLKSLLEGQIQLAQRLEQVLHKRPNVSVFRDGEAVAKKRICVASEDPQSIYELFLSELDGLYAQMDVVFHQNGLEMSMDDSLRKAYVKTRKGSEDQDELYAELHDVNLIPFEFERTSSAMWYAVRRQYSKNRYHTYSGVLERPADTIAVKYRSKCQRRGVDSWLDNIMVMRRYAERDRLAIVWRSISQGEDELSGMYTDETGWSVIKRIPLESDFGFCGSVMHNCVHVVPKRVDYTVPMQQNEIGLLTSLVIDSYEDDVVALGVMVEDLLLQESVVSSG